MFAIATEDPERADAFLRIRELHRIRRDQGIHGPPPTPEEAAAHPFEDGDLERMRSKRSRQIIGTPDEVRQRIDALVEETAADEVVILTITPTFEDRVRSYELIAGAYAREDVPARSDAVAGA